MVAEAAYEAINTTKAVQNAIKFNIKKDQLFVQKQKFDLSEKRKIICLGIGKAALGAISVIYEILGDKISAGYVIDVKEGDLGQRIICRAGTHPLVSEQNIKYTKEMLALLEDLTKDDLVIVAVSGGGSALFELPYEISSEQEVLIFKHLTAQGATISELNTVRKHMSRTKGGQLAKIIYPATFIGLIFSDVPGNDFSMVASGPTVKDTTTARDAQEILQKYDVLERAGLYVCKLVETPKEEKYFDNIHNFLIVSPQAALEAMKERAEELGFRANVFSDPFQGEARKLGRQIVSNIKPQQCLLGTGESTVTIAGAGLGGRNQEMALGALQQIGENQVLLCLASDGHDNTDAAGAIADRVTKSKALALGLDPEFFLANNDSYHFFQSTGDLINTGLTGANAADFFVCLQG